MSNGLWPLAFGLWSLVFGLWPLVFGLFINDFFSKTSDARPKTQDQRPKTITHHSSLITFPTLIHFPSRPDRIALPANLATSERGTNRSACIISRFVKPQITEPFRRANPRNALSTTSSGVCDVRIGGRSICEAS